MGAITELLRFCRTPRSVLRNDLFRLAAKVDNPGATRDDIADLCILATLVAHEAGVFPGDLELAARRRLGNPDRAETDPHTVWERGFRARQEHWTGLSSEPRTYDSAALAAALNVALNAHDAHPRTDRLTFDRRDSAPLDPDTLPYDYIVHTDGSITANSARARAWAKPE